MRYRQWTAVIMILGFWGCAGFGGHYYRQGNAAAVNRNWDLAIQYYQKAIQESPTDHAYQVALSRARIAAGMDAVQNARALAAQGKKDEARQAYEKALTYVPANKSVLDEMRRLNPEEPAVPAVKPFKIEPPVRLRVARDNLELKFTDASVRSIFQALGKHAQISIIYDELFKDMNLTIDISGKEFEDAVSYLCLASKNFYRIIDDKTIIVVPDQPVKRIQYEQNAIQVFYLSNINAQDIFAALQQMLRSQFRAPNIFVDKNLNTITVRDTPANIELAALPDKVRREVPRVVNRLLGQTFLYQEDEESKDDYYLVHRHRGVLEAILGLAGFTLRHDDYHRIYQVVSDMSYCRKRYRLDETLMIVVLRKLYEDRGARLSLASDPVVTVGEVREEYRTITGKERDLGITQYEEILKQLKRLGLIEPLDGRSLDARDGEARLRLRGSVRLILPVQTADEMEAWLRKYRAAEEDE